MRLLDSLHRFDLSEDELLVLRTHRDETGALEGYVRALVADAMRVFGERYDYEAGAPVAVELYPHHDDFAVRTSGLPGIGILGATFGDVVAMDSPSARSIDEGFDWASALWHELAHVVTLNATDNRVSRWFSEGISVLEEWRTGPSAGRSVPLDFISAAQDGRLLPIAELDAGFMQPDSPGRVVLSYLQAGLVCAYLEESPGVDALARILAEYRDGAGYAGGLAGSARPRAGRTRCGVRGVPGTPLRWDRRAGVPRRGRRGGAPLAGAGPRGGCAGCASRRRPLSGLRRSGQSLSAAGGSGGQPRRCGDCHSGVAGVLDPGRAPARAARGGWSNGSRQRIARRRRWRCSAPSRWWRRCPASNDCGSAIC